MNTTTTLPLRAALAAPRRPGAALTRALCRTLFGTRTEGFERWGDVHGPAVVVANHVSLLDGPMLGAFSPVPLHFAVTGEYARRQPWKAVLDVLVATGHGSYSVVDPDAPMGLRRLHRALAQGRWVAVFPEGGISRTGTLGTIHQGALHLAQTWKATVLPVRIEARRTLRAGAPLSFGASITDEARIQAIRDALGD